jgi:ACT domain-containing protein
MLKKWAYISTTFVEEIQLLEPLKIYGFNIVTELKEQRNKKDAENTHVLLPFQCRDTDLSEDNKCSTENNK